MSSDPSDKLSTPEAVARRRQVVYWRMLNTIFNLSDQHKNLEQTAAEINAETGLPAALLDPEMAVDTLVQRFPHLSDELSSILPRVEQEAALEADGNRLRPEVDPLAPVDDDEDDADAESDDATATEGAGAAEAEDEDDDDDVPSPWNDPGDPGNVRRGLLLSKLLINVFGPNASRPNVSAAQYAQWTQDVGAMERAFGFQPGELRGRGGQGGGAGAGLGAGGGFNITESELRQGLGAMEGDIIRRMALREVLKDRALAQKITPSMALVEQILRDKSNLSGEALANAKMLIKRYVDELHQVLKLAVEQTSSGVLDSSVPPKRVFRNLDLKRTIWNNLVNYSPEEQRLYVDRLYFRRTARKTMTNRLIIVVDQSGSMVDSMVNCTILASIFAGLPKVEAHLIAYDTRYIDLTEWVHDPFEVLLRTQLGGGTQGMVCMEEVRGKILHPKNTALVWISDFYDFEDERLFTALKAIKDSGVHLIPVGSVTSSGYFSVNAWFKQRFKEIGAPLISGSVKTLIREIKEFVAI